MVLSFDLNTLELCWKSSKKILLANGIETDTPKNVMRELGQLGWVSDPASWLDYVEKRNMTSHMYNEEVANEIFKVIGQFIKDANLLLSVLGSKNK
jgi:nucleotidyltransferase substrate binding protein (TIGR01987 family)